MALASLERGSGLPIVLLPWFSLDGTVMAEAFEPIFSATDGWRRIYLDLPGTGGSSSVDPTSDAVLDAVMDTIASTIGDDPVPLIGCSYGGYLAAGFTRRRPTQVAGLLTVCAGVRIRPEDRDLGGVLDSPPEAGWLEGVPEQLHRHFSHAIGVQTRSVADRVARAVQLGAPTDDDYLGRLRSTGYQLSDETAPHRYHGAVTVVAGRRDRVAGYLDHVDSLTHYPHGELVALADAGHYLPFERPARFASLIADWLARVGDEPGEAASAFRRSSPCSSANSTATFPPT